ncbi:MAG: response regulator [Robiginitomaculum sp.]|nr:response regulator [Robiginitomaculum sp.]
MNDEQIILVAIGDQAGRASLAKDISALGYKVRASDDLSIVLKMTKKGQLSLVVLDIDLFDSERNGFDVLQEIGRIDPKCPVIALGGDNTVLSSLLASRFGAIDFFARPYSFSSLAATIKSALMNASEKRAAVPNSSITPLVAKSSAMQQVVREITNSARSRLPVLISGSSGSGKFLAANLIHKYGEHLNSRLHCLVPSVDLKLLNNIKAADTLVLRRLNMFSEEDQHLLCDWFDVNEQAEVPARVISIFCNKSSVTTVPKNIIPELLGRLQVLHIKLPDLQQRRDDISELAREFLGQASNYQKTLNKEAIELLSAYSWKGNARELKNLMSRIAIQFNSRVIDCSQIRQSLEYQFNEEQAKPDVSLVVKALLSSQLKQENLHQFIIGAVEKPLLEIALQQTGNNQIKAAKLLGINRNTFRKKIQMHLLSQKK